MTFIVLFIYGIERLLRGMPHRKNGCHIPK